MKIARVLRVVSAVLLAWCSGFTMAQVPAAENTTDRNHPFVRHVEAVYAQLLKAEKEGDVALFKRTRAKVSVDLIMENLKRMGKTESDLGAMLKGSADWQTDVSKFDFIRVDATRGAARFLYRRDGKNERGPTVEFAAIMAHWDDGAWRIGWVGNAPGPKQDITGKERNIEELANHPKFRL